MTTLRLIVVVGLLWLSLPAATQEQPATPATAASPVISQELSAPAPTDKTKGGREAAQERKPMALVRSASPGQSRREPKPAAAGLCDGS